MALSLSEVSVLMTQYGMSLFLAFGVFGNIFNIFMFTRKEPLRNSCSLYLLASSTLNLFIVSWGISPSLYDLDHVDPSTYSYIYCKLRLYTIHTIIMMSRTFIVLACADRFALCSSSIRIRSFNQRRVAIRLIIIVPIIWPILTMHIAIFTVYSQNKCFMGSPYALIYSIYLFLAAGIIPPALMCFFGILTIRARRQLHARLSIANRTSRRDHTLLVMLMSEVIVYITTTILYPVTTLYHAVTSGQPMSPESAQIASFFSYMGGSFLIYLNYSSAFYVYFVSARNFRQDCKRALFLLYGCMTGHRNQIGPMTTYNDSIQHHGTVLKNQNTTIA